MTATETETETEFFQRAHRLSGLSDADWQAVLHKAASLGEGDSLPGAIVARWNHHYLCTVGYPDGEREDGSPYWGPSPENWALATIY